MQFITDSCRYEVWSVAQAMQSAADESATMDILCRLPRQGRSIYLQTFLLPAARSHSDTTTAANGETITTTIDYPPEPADQSGLAEMLDGLAAACAPNSPAL